MFVPFRTETTAAQLAHVLLKEVVSRHGLPKEIISDRDKLFTSRFWTTLTAELGINQKMSTAYHPQTDGQTERMNQTVETYLRHYVNYRQDNWVKMLPTAEYAYNSTANETTGESPFMANYGYHPTIVREPRGDTGKSPLAKMEVSELRLVHDRIREKINRQRQATTTTKTYQPGDKVYVKTKNIKTKRPSKKLDAKKIRPFQVVRNIKNTSYELKLPEEMRIHNTFHASLLEPSHSDTPEQTEPTPVEPDEEYEVERILEARKVSHGTKREYLVKWKGYTEDENTWEPESNMTNCHDALAEF